MYFLYPETCGVRLEDMDALFGDATRALGTPAPSTPALHAESDALLRPESPVPQLDIRNRAAMRSPRSAGAAIRGLPIDPPDDVDDGKPRASGSGGVGGWIARVMGRGKNGGSSRGSQYAPIDQRDD